MAGKPCLIGLYEKCRIYDNIKDLIKQEKAPEWGTPEWMKVYCAMCLKAVYAQAHLKRADEVKVVNTL